ncbi:FtsH-binding integral membrane protein [Peribacillus deserti]|uniref:FtsH-binding integral membrane protein n=1 Tax=Peribacillus deserti TaxID=673318 RepID=A0ABS2QE87_9BACI|nr:Bax inhibitor-1/YccA family protein [Peribacillus deserti]MBM7691335.1 FtsH-binding integral membrane protein [Peribacillus deserti]
MQQVISVGKRSLFQKVIQVFIVTLLLATAGLYAGQFVPGALMLPLMVAEVIMLISAFWLRKRKAVGYTFVYAFAVISGITTYPIVSHYISQSGAQIVLYAFGMTLGIFTVFGLIGSRTKKDLGFLSTFLMVAVLALIFIGIFSIFSPLNDGGLLAFSGIGALVFSLFILYDFNQMKHRGISEEMVPLLALSLYLDFLNLFINLLRFLGILSKD